MQHKVTNQESCFGSCPSMRRRTTRVYQAIFPRENHVFKTFVSRTGMQNQMIEINQCLTRVSCYHVLFYQIRCNILMQEFPVTICHNTFGIIFTDMLQSRLHIRMFWLEQLGRISQKHVLPIAIRTIFVQTGTGLLTCLEIIQACGYISVCLHT